MKTFSPKPGHIERRWYLVDASDAVLGRLASEVATVLKGKHKPIYAPHVDTGDHVVVVNASKVRLTGNKLESKQWHRHSGYPGGLRSISYSRLLATRPELAVEKAIKGMLPKNRLGRQMGRKLKVYAGGSHEHAAQKPEPLALGTVPAWSGLPAPKPSTQQAQEDADSERRPRSARKPTARRLTGKKTTAKRTSGKSPAKRSSAKPAAKAGPKKRAARKPAENASAKKTAAKKSAAKKPAARRSAKRSAKEES